MSWAIGITNLAILAWIFCKLSKKFKELQPYYWPAILMKLASGLGLGILYLYYYDVGDTFVFFNEASDLANLLLKEPLAYFDFLLNSSTEAYETGYERQPRALFFVKLTSVFAFVSANNYWISSLYFSTLSFFGAAYLCKVLIRRYYKYKLGIIFAFLFFPSTLFWTSGIIKESLAAAAVFFLTGVVLHTLFRKRLSVIEIFLALVFMVVLWKIKYYYAGVLLILLFSLLATYLLIANSKKVRNSKVGITATFLISAVVVVFGVSQLHPNFNLDRVGIVIVKNYHDFARVSDVGDYIQFDNLTADFIGLLYNSPKALFSGVLRPFIWETDGNLFKVFTSLENIMVLLLSVLTMFNLNRVRNNQDYLLIITSLFFFIVMVTFLALSAPNFGTLARYKSIAMPFFIVLISLNHQYIDKLMQWKFWNGSS